MRSRRFAIRRPPGWPAALALVALTLALLPAPASQAAHPHPYSDAHLNFQHYNTVNPDGPGGRDEQYCAESYADSALSDSSARARAIETLNNQTSDKEWDGLGNWRIDLWPTQYRCGAYSADVLATIEVEIRYNTYWSHCGGVSCVRHSGPMWNADYGHNDSRWAIVYMDIDHHSGVLNHEFGHVFGLADHGNGGSSCEPPSLMHSTIVGYPCGNWPYRWPSPADRQTVERIIYGQIY